MREIKFRAIIPNAEKAQEDGKINPFIIFHFNLLEVLHNEVANYYKWNILKRWMRSGGVPDRYTGIKEKNEKEIYEGDIVKIDKDLLSLWPSSMMVNEIIVVEFLNYGWFPFCHGVPAPHDLEIIGNIHENADLLNK